MNTELEALIPVVPDGLRFLGGISPTTIWREEKAGRLRIVRIGRRRFLEPEEIRRYLRVCAQTTRKPEECGDSRSG